jgi:hypothetical protein
MLISSRNTVIETLRNILLPALWVFLTPVKSSQPPQTHYIFFGKKMNVQMSTSFQVKVQEELESNIKLFGDCQLKLKDTEVIN